MLVLWRPGCVISYDVATWANTYSNQAINDPGQLHRGYSNLSKFIVFYVIKSVAATIPPRRTCPVGPAKFALCNVHVRKGGNIVNVWLRVQWYSTYAIIGENLPILDFFVATLPENAAKQQEIVILPYTTTLLLILRIYSSFLPSFLPSFLLLQ